MSDWDSDLYEINFTKDSIIYFKKYSRKRLYDSKMLNIEKITISFARTRYNAACATLEDGSRLKLYVSNYNYDSSQQIVIMNPFIPDPLKPSGMHLGEMVSIVLDVIDLSK
jgi:hypothetical protein